MTGVARSSGDSQVDASASDQSSYTEDPGHASEVDAQVPKPQNASASRGSNTVDNREVNSTQTSAEDIAGNKTHSNISSEYDYGEDIKGPDNGTHLNQGDSVIPEESSDVAYKHMFFVSIASFVGLLLLAVAVVLLVWRCKVGIRRKLRELPMNTSNSGKRKSNCFKDAWNGLWERRQQRRLLRHLEESAALLGRRSHQDFLLREPSPVSWEPSDLPSEQGHVHCPQRQSG